MLIPYLLFNEIYVYVWFICCTDRNHVTRRVPSVHYCCHIEEIFTAYESILYASWSIIDDINCQFYDARNYYLQSFMYA